MNVLFRVDSSSKIGLGHLMRCLVLAEQYKKDNIIFAAQNLEGNANQKIIDQGYRLILLGDNSTDELCKKIALLHINNVIFDHYGIDYKFEKIVKKRTGVQILSFDDTYEKHYCDILLNHNIYADAEKYKDLVSEFCEIRCGRKYTLIRDEFKRIKIRKRPINKEKSIIFVSLGGSDPENISLTVLKILVEFDNIVINLATTSSNKNINKLQNFAKQYQNITICIDCNIAEMMNSSDFAIITPSVVIHEAMAVQLPFISIRTADNQKMMHKYLRENNYLALEKSELNKLQKEVQKYMSKASLKMSTIMEYDDYQFKNYTVLNNKEQEIALDFRNQNKEWMISKNIIKLEDHREWINSLNNNYSTLYYLVFKDGAPFMAIDYHDIDYVKKEAYWGYFLGDNKFKSEVLKIEKIIIDIAFNRLNIDKLLCINDVNNSVIGIHKFFGFQKGEIITIDGKDFLKMFLLKGH